jgi:hypothetical protein
VELQIGVLMKMPVAMPFFFSVYARSVTIARVPGGVPSKNSANESTGNSGSLFSASLTASTPPSYFGPSLPALDLERQDAPASVAGSQAFTQFASRILTLAWLRDCGMVGR